MTRIYKDYDGPIVSLAKARESGLKRYFTGKRCKNGHLKERATHNSVCVECCALATLANAKKNREKINSDRREKYSKDEQYREKAVKTSQEVRKNNEYSAKSGYRWWLKNKEKTKIMQKLYVSNNREKVRETRKIYYKKNKEVCLSLNRSNRAKRMKAEGTHNKSDIINIFNMQKGLCAYCKISIKEKYHVDHITSLAKGGTNWPKNLQLLCVPCNMHKHDKDPIDFAKSLGMLL